MTREEAKKILENEDLRYYNWFEEHDLKEHEVCIKKENDLWIVYSVDERASIVDSSIKKFNNESDALEHFIDIVRTEKLLFD